ncbi:MAG TPA: beta-ketoacyl synthase chain length factor [Albitalea sp.]|nr:beta-ketoacyl synthase chain length factor [Albitalea sp.]
MKTIFVEAVEMLGPGWSNWEEGAALLRDPGACVSTAALPAGDPAMLGPNERRRSTETIRLALRVVELLARRSSVDLSETTSVFASSAGDLQMTERVCLALSLPGAPVSPTHFHNVVHNATAGYWSIAARARAASTSLSAGDESFVAGLFEAWSMVDTDRAPVLLVAYEHPAPAVIDRHWPVCAPFATAMLLSPEPLGRNCHAMRMQLVPLCDDTRMAGPGWERLRTGNAAARALPLLERLATGSSESVCLRTAANGSRSSVALDVRPA